MLKFPEASYSKRVTSATSVRGPSITRGQALYFQPLVPTTDSWEALLGDAAASTRRFETTLASLRAVREQQPGKPHVLEHDGLRLSVHPGARSRRPVS